MNILSPQWTPSTAALRRGGIVLLWTGFGAGLLVLLALAWWAPELLPLFPILLLGTAGLVYVVQRPFVHLCVVLAASALIIEHKPGIQPQEVAYGLYCIVYLGSWFFAEIGLRRKNPFDTPEAKALAGFLLLVVLMLPLSVFFGGTARLILRELTALVLLAFAFPMKAAIARHRHAVRTFVLIGAGLAIFIAVRNLFTYQSILHDAERIADMLRGRVDANVAILAVASIFASVFLVYVERLRRAALYLALFGLFFSGVILSLSRGFWVSTVFGFVVLFVVVERSRKVRIAWMTAGGGLAILALGFIFFGDFVLLFVYGLIERFSTIQDAATKDISMLGRIYESRGAWAYIVKNPILGHGIGAPFTFHSILSRTTITQTFVHNGYVALWYKFGVVGTLLVLFWWLGSMVRGVRLFRRADLPMFHRLIALAAAASLSIFILSTITSNPFYHKDYLFTLAYLVGLILGINARYGQRLTAPISRPI